MCVAGKQVVLLDLERDRYLAVAHPHPIARWVRGWPLPQSGPVAAAHDGEPAPENGLLAKMISQGLLVADPALGKEAVPVIADEPKVALVEDDLHVRRRVGVRYVWSFCAAYATAQWSLKHRPIKEVVQAVHLRKKRAPGASGLDIATSRELVTAFIHLRPFFYTVRNACLLDSLTLIHFLAAYGVFPTWVFGVKTDPFHAHCWLQQGDFVFNDSPHFIKVFSPILVV
jgi:Transglutaminase-like superfamily